MLDDPTRQALEFDDLLRLAAGLAETPLGKRRTESLQPLTDASRIRRLQDETTEAKGWVQQLRPSFAGLDDPAALVAILGVDEVALEPTQILLAAHHIGRAHDSRSALKPHCGEYPLLWSHLAALPDLSDWTGQVQRAIDAEGRILDSASGEIRRIRAAGARCRQQLKEKLQTYLSHPEVLQDTYITERNGRLVIPVRAEKKNAIEGVVHGASSSGATVFLEPLAAVGLNNDLALLLDQELIETRRILIELTRQLRDRRPDFLAIVETIGELDAAAARGRLSLLCRGAQPELEADPGRCGWKLRQARHPMLIHFMGWDKVVPIDLELDRQTEILIISGPNTGGKTAVLKALGLFAAMAQSGLHIPAEEAQLPLFARIRADIGDHQSLQENLSTFSSHVLRLQRVLDEADSGTLVLLDELGTGTDPAQGAALALAVLETLRERGARVVATTHLDRLKAFAAEHGFSRNAAVEFDEELLRPTFRLLLGLPGHSAALSIAERLGLDRSVVRLAHSNLDSRDAAIEGYLRRLRAQEEELERAKRNLEAEARRGAEERARLLSEVRENARLQQKGFEARLQGLEAEFGKALQNELRSVSDRIERDRQRDQRSRKAQQLRQLYRERSREFASPQPAQTAESELPALHQGVRVISLGVWGTFLGMEGKEARVDVGGKRLQVPLSDLKTGKAGAETERRLPANVTFVPAALGGAPSELNLIGQTVDEALSRVDKFLDQAFLENHGSVRLIHGRGSGRLGNAVREFLKNHPHVATAAPAAPNQGGAAVTVVKLREE
ncbi:MAG: Smr/MutS family protein [Acidobacteria bacterium]|nr:Smr/MutS family protein [Acidobacteriota bacterium]